MAEEPTVWRELAHVAHRLHFIDVGGIRTRCLEAGSGPPVVLLHGTGGHLEAFARNVGPLSRPFHVVAFDLLGHGFTDKPPDRPYDWPGLTTHVLATLDHLGLDRPVLVGEGVGAQLAQWIGLRHRDRVRGIALCSTIIPPVEEAEDPVSAASMNEFQALTRRALEDPSWTLMRERMTWLFDDPADATDELVTMRTQMWREPDFQVAQRALLASYVDPESRARHAITRKELAGMDVPVLIVWSERNPLMSLDLARRFAASVGDLRFELFECSAMWPQYEEADRFNQLIEEFATSVLVD